MSLFNFTLPCTANVQSVQCTFTVQCTIVHWSVAIIVKRPYYPLSNCPLYINSLFNYRITELHFLTLSSFLMSKAFKYKIFITVKYRLLLRLSPETYVILGLRCVVTKPDKTSSLEPVELRSDICSIEHQPCRLILSALRMGFNDWIREQYLNIFFLVDVKIKNNFRSYELRLRFVCTQLQRTEKTEWATQDQRVKGISGMVGRLSQLNHKMLRYCNQHSWAQLT